ncbi:MAG: type II toxin-antitoxin system Phd/YefM family antitoxin [Ignavibacteriaceae bacterium]|nr:type II toxin-antitoxin system Phd/YefM family antitoxin [Ignavibacteriaceae bacterium]
MRLSESVKSISYLKANAANLIEKINKEQKTYVITQNGEAKVIVQDIKVYEKTQEALALLKILAMSGKNLKNKRYKSMDKTFKDVRKKISKFKKDTK